MYKFDNYGMGERIRSHREAYNISREKFAEMLNVTTKFCSDIESGARGVSLKTLVNISVCLDLSTDYILFGDITETSDPALLRMIEKCPDAKMKFLKNVIDQMVKSYSED